MSQKKKNNIIIGVLCAVVLLMVVGYATYPYTPKLKKSYNTRLNSYIRVRINQVIYSFFYYFFNNRSENINYNN